MIFLKTGGTKAKNSQRQNYNKANTLLGGTELRQKISEYCKVIPENLIITNGSDDALILICHTYITPGMFSCAKQAEIRVNFPNKFLVAYFRGIR